MRSNLLRIRLLEILEREGPMNTCQVCRRLHGKGKNDVQFCRTEKVVERGRNNLKIWGFFYENCRLHKPNLVEVYRALKTLAERGFIETKKLRFKDPQKKGRNWDTMRFWGVDLTPIVKQTLIAYVDGK